MQSLAGLQAGNYHGTKRLKLSCNLTSFPREILSLFDTLEILDLSNNPLSILPKDFSRLHKLKVAFFSDCHFTTFPSELAQCRSLEMIAFKNNHMTTIPEDALPRKLRWLILTNNLITHLPSSIGRCHGLQKCMLAGNRLTSIPAEMAQCRKLGLFRISANQLPGLPDWLFNMSDLSFLSFAGNPCSSSSIENPTLAEIPWSDISVQHLLGEGASGIISQGTWSTTTGPKDVAVKLFKGAVTSDGLPTDEMNACIAAGQHPQLIDPIGRITGHPEKNGLVLELIPPRYKNLGLPPTLESCTRDAFHPETVFSIRECHSILLGIASAAAHLHGKGIAHGDLYAHNILVDDTGHALLGDFGAATIYARGSERAEGIERMEVLAFGHLVEDLLGLVQRDVVVHGDVCHGGFGEEEVEWVLDEKDAGLLEGLNHLHWRCTDPVVLERPGFEEVVGVLGDL